MEADTEIYNETKTNYWRPFQEREEQKYEQRGQDHETADLN